ncbi:hypothetical protein [Azospirillum argentinense]|uniref:hypothetical protein n=1 Tax=Azospirillum argentinense TaxID=2970906 RepID=UPI0011AF1D9F|nr:hypothetical protein [Azospirillum argentinense]
MVLKFDEKYKETLINEWETLRKYNKGMVHLLRDLSLFAQKTFSKDVIITSIFRTEERQSQIYESALRSGSIKKVPKSAHSVWAAVDLRTQHLNDYEIKQMCNFIKRHYDKTNDYKIKMGDRKYQNSNTVIVHEIDGYGRHFHINYTGPTILINWSRETETAMRCHDYSGEVTKV